MAHISERQATWWLAGESDCRVRCAGEHLRAGVRPVHGHRAHFEESVTYRLPHDEEQEKLEIDMNQPVLVL